MGKPQVESISSSLFILKHNPSLSLTKGRGQGSCQLEGPSLFKPHILAEVKAAGGGGADFGLVDSLCNLGQDNYLQPSRRRARPRGERTPPGCQGLRGQEPPLDQQERAQAKGRRRGILLKGEARRGPEGWRRGRHVRAGMRAGHVRLAGRSRVQLRQSPDPCTSPSSPQAQSRGLSVRPGPIAREWERTHKGRSVSSPRPQGSTELGIHPVSPVQDSGFSSLPSPRRSGRQTAGRANGGAQSVNFVFARHSQPVCAGFSQVPPSVSGAPFWPHTVGRSPPPS